MSNKEIKNNNEKKTVEDSTVNQENNITTGDDNSKDKEGATESKIIVKNTEQPKKNFVKKTIAVLGISITVIGSGLVLYKSQIKSNEPKKRFEQREVDYTQFINNWNKQVQKNTSKREFLLSRESNDKMIKQLENWMKNFYIPEIKDSLEYNQFLEKNKLGQPTSFDTTMGRDKIRELLKKATKEKVMSKIVKKVLMMNDMELWKELTLK